MSGGYGQEDKRKGAERRHGNRFYCIAQGWKMSSTLVLLRKYARSLQHNCPGVETAD